VETGCSTNQNNKLNQANNNNFNAQLLEISNNTAINYQKTDMNSTGKYSA
jgi:hypothetical protein